MTKKRDVEINELFKVERGNGKYTRSYAESHPGNVPIYSASLSAPIAYGDVADYSGPRLTFTTNGYGGSVQIIEGDFTCNGDRAVLLPREGVVLPDLRYVARVLEQTIRPLAVGRRADAGSNEYTKISPERVESVTIPFLLDDEGMYDYHAMESFGETIQRASKLQANLASRIEQLRAASIVLEVGDSVDVKLGDPDRFTSSIGKRVLRPDLSDSGEVPVYSANAREPMGFVEYSRDGNEFNEPSLIWGIDGVFDWNLVPAKQPFVPTDHCGRLQVLDPNLDPEYLLFALRATKDSHGFDRVFRANLSNIKELAVSVPVDGNGYPDIARQQELARRYRRLDAIRDEIIQKVSPITGVVVTPQW